MKQTIKTVGKGVTALVAGSTIGVVANEIVDSFPPKPIVFYTHRPLCPKATNSSISSQTSTFSQQKPSASKG